MNRSILGTLSLKTDTATKQVKFQEKIMNTDELFPVDIERG